MNITESFRLVEEKEVKEINSKIFLYHHLKSGAEVMSVVNDDENKVFGITFRTPPTDSTGIAHIMEHSVLCGSRKYPVKEPFIELVKGSLNTFLNAFTYPDKTCYPVASTNLQDFYNLVDVYLDAVLYPLITPQTLMQEGWHYELNQIDEEMTYKGVVFNEMKGAYSSPDDILGDESQMQLLPDTPYGFQSGGDPECIPDLTYEQFKKFHETYYHPSNSRIYFYGNDNPEKRLELLDEYLRDFDAIQLNSLPELQSKFTQPVRKIIPYDSGEDSESAKAYITVNWLLPEGNDPEFVLSLGILEHVLLGTPASPLRKLLTESGLGEDLVGRGITDEQRQLSFSTGMRGVNLEQVDRVENFILSSLEQIVNDGIDPETIEASLNTIEFNLRENNTGPYPRGLLVMLRALSAWIYNRDPIAPLEFQSYFDHIKDKLGDGSFRLEDLIQEFLINNNHRVTVILMPDNSIASLREEKEKSKLRKAYASFTPEQLQNLVNETIELKKHQETPDSPEALATIPMLTKEDLDKKITTIPNHVLQTKPATILHHDLFTSQILYLDLGFDISTIPLQYLPYMRLFMRSLLEMGTQKESFVEFIQRIGRETGGIGKTLFTSERKNQDGVAAYLFIRSKVMVDKTPGLLSILKDIILIPNLKDKDRFKQILLEEKSSMEAGIVPSGHRVVNNRLRAQISTAARMTEQMSGIDYLTFLRSLVDNFDNEWSNVISVLADIKSNLFNQNHLIVNATIDQENWDQIQPQINSLIANIPVSSLREPASIKTLPSKNEGLTIPSQVNFVGKGANLYEYGYVDHGSMSVITQYLRGTWLWEKVRVLGGAYGAFCNFDRLSGAFTYLSYRDPNLVQTIENYDQTENFLRTLKLSDSELVKSIIGAIGDLDAYQLPDAKGYTSMIRYLVGVDDQERQRYRDELLSTSIKDFHDLADVLKKFNENAQIVALGSISAIEKTNQELNMFDVIKKII